MENTKLKSILIVEDEKLLLEAIATKTTLLGIETTTFTTGTEALAMLKTADKIPDVIWLDYHLQDMDGLQFLVELKKDNRLINIPVFVISNSMDDEKVKNILQLGAEKYLLKAQHSLNELIDIISNNIDKN